MGLLSGSLLHTLELQKCLQVPVKTKPLIKHYILVIQLTSFHTKTQRKEYLGIFSNNSK